jgi:pyrophosphatase PpaX
MQRSISTVLFDLDGTLINTNPLITETFRQTLNHYMPERVFTDEDIMEFIGPTLDQTFSGLIFEKKDEMTTYYRKINKELHDQMVEIYPTVEEGLKQLKENGIRLGIVSSKKNDMVLHGLQYFKLDHLFEIVIGNDDVINPKPHPEPIELAITKMNITKEEVIFVGDNSHDIESGKNAGVITCGVSWSLRGANYLKQFNPDYILEDMTQLMKIIKEVQSINGKQ